MKYKHIALKSDNLIDVLQESGLDFIAEKQEVFTGAGIDCSDYTAIVENRNNTVMSIMGKDYEPVQTFEAFALCDIFKREYGAGYKNAIIKENGKSAYIEMEMNNRINLGNGDFISPRLRFGTSFDGSLCNFGMIGGERYLCNNGLWLTRKKYAFKVKHTKNVSKLMNIAIDAYAGIIKGFEYFEQDINILKNKMLDSQNAEKLIKEIMGVKDDKISTRKKNQINKIYHAFENGAGNGGRTTWDLYNGIVEYIDHDSFDNQDKRIDFAMDTGLKLQTKAFEKLLAA